MSPLRDSLERSSDRPVRPIEEQLWPIHVAIILFGSSLAWVVATTLRFDSPRFRDNALTWLILIPPAIGAGIWLVNRLESRLVRRATLLSVVLSLLWHLTLLITLAWFQLGRKPWEVQEARPSVSPPEQTVIPDYWLTPPDGVDRPRQDFEKPVETGVPDRQPEPLAQKRASVPDVQPPEPIRSPSAPEPGTQASSRPRQQVVHSAPRESQSQAALNRSGSQQTVRIDSRVQRPPPVALEPAPDRLATAQFSVSRSAVQPEAALAELPHRVMVEDADPPDPLPLTRDRSGGPEPLLDPVAGRTASSLRVRSPLGQSRAQRVPLIERPALEPAREPELTLAAESQPVDRTQVAPATSRVRMTAPSPATSPALAAASQPNRAEVASPAPNVFEPSVQERQLPERSDPLAAIRVRSAAIPVPDLPSPDPSSVGATIQPGATSHEIGRLKTTPQPQDNRVPISPGPPAVTSLSMNRSGLPEAPARLSAAQQGPAQGERPPRLGRSSLVAGPALPAATPIATTDPAATPVVQPPDLARPVSSTISEQDQSIARTTNPSAANAVVPLSSPVAAVLSPSSIQPGPPLPPSETASDNSDSSGALAATDATTGAVPRRDRPTRGPATSARAAMSSPVAPKPVADHASVAIDSDSPPALNATTTQLSAPTRVPVSGTPGPPLDAPKAPAGAMQLPALDSGYLARSAQASSQEMTLSSARFIRQNVGGPPTVTTKVPIPADAYRSRLERRGLDRTSGHGQAPLKTEEAIERGLAFLARHQMDDGSWRLRFPEPYASGEDLGMQIESPTAATGLALLAFLGAGYHHQGDTYHDAVAAGLRFLLDNQKPDGDFYIPQDARSNRSAWLYSHAIATIAMCEAFGMTQDPQLQQPAQKALDFISSSQHPHQGGWRYQPGVGTDTSVTGWMMMALKSGQLANLEVSSGTYEGIAGWLDAAQDSQAEPHLYRYNPFAPPTPERAHGREASSTMTAVGLLMRMYLGWSRDDQPLKSGADYLAENLPAEGTVREPLRDTYFWYYATQVMFHMGGQYWQRWIERLHPLLVDSQIQDGALAGSWDPFLPVADRWAHHAGRIYVTTMNLLSLEVYYRHLPLYEATAE